MDIAEFERSRCFLIDTHVLKNKTHVVVPSTVGLGEIAGERSVCELHVNKNRFNNGIEGGETRWKDKFETGGRSGARTDMTIT